MERRELAAKCTPVFARLRGGLYEFHQDKLVFAAGTCAYNTRDPKRTCVEKQCETLCLRLEHTWKALGKVPFQEEIFLRGLKAPSVVYTSATCRCEAKRPGFLARVSQYVADGVKNRTRNKAHRCCGEKFKLPFKPRKNVRGGAGL